MIRLALAKARARHEASEHSRDSLAGSSSLALFRAPGLQRKQGGLVLAANSSDCEPDRFQVSDCAELEFGHRSHFSPCKDKHQVPVDDDSDREAGSDGDRPRAPRDGRDSAVRRNNVAQEIVLFKESRRRSKRQAHESWQFLRRPPLAAKPVAVGVIAHLETARAVSLKSKSDKGDAKRPRDARVNTAVSGLSPV